MSTMNWWSLLKKFLWGEEHFGLKAQSSFAVFPCAYCPPPRPQLPGQGVGSGKRAVQEEERGEGRGDVSLQMCFNSCWQPTCMLHIQPNFQNPSETIPSLPEEFQKENKNKKPQVFRYWDLANQQALPGLGQRMQWSLPPLTALRMNTNDSIKHCVTLDTEEVSEAVPSPCPVAANTRAENSSQICYRKS